MAGLTLTDADLDRLESFATGPYITRGGFRPDDAGGGRMTADATLRERVEAVTAFENELPPTRKRPASPGWSAACKRMALAWEAARAYVRGET